jgi:hypothetical protein
MFRNYKKRPSSTRAVEPWMDTGQKCPACAIIWHNDLYNSAVSDNFSMFMAIKQESKRNSLLHVKY